MISEIPLAVLPSEDDFTVSVELDGRDYVLGFSYSAASDRWYLDCYVTRTADVAEPIVLGVPCCASYPLLAGVTHPDRPAGELQFAAVDDPGRDDLGTFARLYYFDAAEFTS